MFDIHGVHRCISLRRLSRREHIYICCWFRPRQNTSALAAGMAGPAYQLRIDAHQVHRIDGDGIHAELVISTLKDITLTVVIVDQLDQICSSAALPLSANLIYENGQPVEQLDRHQQVMKGGSAQMTNGTATFKLRVNVLSSLRQNQKFRILISTEEENFRYEHGKLVVITNAMRSITKLWRGVREPADQQTIELAADPAAPQPAAGQADDEGIPLKRKSTELSHLLEMISDHDRSIGDLRESQQAIMSELKSLRIAEDVRRRQE